MTRRLRLSKTAQLLGFGVMGAAVLLIAFMLATTWAVLEQVAERERPDPATSIQCGETLQGFKCDLPSRMTEPDFAP